MRFSVLKFFLLFLLLGAVVAKGAAQQQAIPPVDTLAARYGRTMGQQYSLNPGQQQRLAQVYKHRQQDLQKLPPPTTADSVARRQTLERLYLEFENVVKEVLSPAQIQQYEQRKQEHKAALKVQAQAKGVTLREWP